MILSPRQVDPSYSEDLKVYLSVLRDSHDHKEDESEARNENEHQEAVCQGLGMNSRHPEDDTGMERWDGNDGLEISLNALSGRFGRTDTNTNWTKRCCGRERSK